MTELYDKYSRDKQQGTPKRGFPEKKLGYIIDSSEEVDINWDYPILWTVTIAYSARIETDAFVSLVAVTKGSRQTICENEIIPFVGKTLYAFGNKLVFNFGNTNSRVLIIQAYPEATLSRRVVSVGVGNPADPIVEIPPFAVEYAVAPYLNNVIQEDNDGGGNIITIADAGLNSADYIGIHPEAVQLNLGAPTANTIVTFHCYQ